MPRCHRHDFGILIVGTQEKTLRVTVLPGRHFRHNGRHVEVGTDISLSREHAEQMVAAGHCRFSSDDIEEVDETDPEKGGNVTPEGDDDPDKGEDSGEGSDEPDKA